MKGFIVKALVEMHLNCTTDKYGQVGRSNFTPRSLFGDRADEVDVYLNANPGLLSLATYSAVYGCYQAYSIEDSEIRKICSESLSKNPNYLHNVNRW